MRDNLGDRMKRYERQETDKKFMPGLPIYARLDGKCFSKFTSGMNKPFDNNMVECMTNTTKFLVEKTNAIIGYCQSDEISLFWNVSENKDSEFLFNGKIQKFNSILSGMASSKFVLLASKYWPDHVEKRVPSFDCRIIQMPSLEEIANMFLWRNLDATKNAVSCSARSYYSHKELQNKSCSEMQEMLFQKGINFNDYPPFFKRGVWVKNYKVSKYCDYLKDNIVRNEIGVFDAPPMNTIENKVDFILGEEYRLFSN